MAYSQSLTFEENIRDDSIHLSLINDFYGPVLVKFEKNDNIPDQLRLPQELVIAARDTIDHVVCIARELTTDTTEFNWGDYFLTYASLGDPYHSSHTEGYEYALPFMKNKAYTIIQGWNGSFSHNSKKSKYAIDFLMPIGDTICAAREGIVISTEESYTENGGKELTDKANQIVVLHDDGTLAFYVHLDYEGVLVDPGTYVRKGEPIGLSGNTGYSTKPHLHFVVREAPDTSVPTYFMGYKGKELKKNRKYKRKS
jgi:murein DD-endopeptidase MepM/ murein hydrolase activator NlpD